MFVISQLALHYLGICNNSSLPSYSIAIGLVLYASLYLYLLFYNADYIYIFNKFIIYIIGIDLLISTFVYFKNQSSVQDIDEKNVNKPNYENVKLLSKQCEEIDDASESTISDEDDYTNFDVLDKIVQPDSNNKDLTTLDEDEHEHEDTCSSEDQVQEQTIDEEAIGEALEKSLEHELKNVECSEEHAIQDTISLTYDKQDEVSENETLEKLQKKKRGRPSKASVQMVSL